MLVIRVTTHQPQSLLENHLHRTLKKETKSILFIRFTSCSIQKAQWFTLNKQHIKRIPQITPQNLRTPTFPCPQPLPLPNPNRSKPSQQYHPLPCPNCHSHSVISLFSSHSPLPLPPIATTMHQVWWRSPQPSPSSSQDLHLQRKRAKRYYK